MKKIGIIAAIVFLVLLGIGIWLIASSNPKNAVRETVTVPVELPSGQ